VSCEKKYGNIIGMKKGRSGTSTLALMSDEKEMWLKAAYA
jgi:hypothetical protein